MSFDDDDNDASVIASVAAETTCAAYLRADDADVVVVLAPSRDVDGGVDRVVAGPGNRTGFGWL